MVFVNKVFAGDPGVAIGTYLKIMAVLGMENNFAEMAAHDEVGIKLQNMKMNKATCGLPSFPI